MSSKVRKSNQILPLNAEEIKSQMDESSPELKTTKNDSSTSKQALPTPTKPPAVITTKTKKN